MYLYYAALQQIKERYQTTDDVQVELDAALDELERQLCYNNNVQRHNGFWCSQRIGGIEIYGTEFTIIPSIIIFDNGTSICIGYYKYENRKQVVPVTTMINNFCIQLSYMLSA